MYKIGEYIKIKQQYKSSLWYHNKIMKILNIVNIDFECYVVDYKFGGDSDLVPIAYVYQDDECIRLLRIKKLKRI